MKHKDYRSGTLVERKGSEKRSEGTVIRNSYGRVIDGVPNTFKVHVHISGTNRRSTSDRKPNSQGNRVRQRAG